MSLLEEITELLLLAGLPVTGVNNKDGTREGIRIDLINPTPEQTAEAEAIADQVFADPQ